LAELGRDAHARPDLERVAAVGHSLGGGLAAEYAGTAGATGLPVPAALLAAMPGCAGCDFAVLAGIPASTRVLVVVGNEDTLAGEGIAKQIWAGLTVIPPDRRDYVRLIGDAHGQPPLVADHFVPLTGGDVDLTANALDWYGTWKLLDALMRCSFADQDCQVALGNTPEQRFMGAWSDGVPVTEAHVTDDPGPPTAPQGTPTS
jgi:pimeloyl-ACP methyl ester carboxylesterase